MTTPWIIAHKALDSTLAIDIADKSATESNFSSTRGVAAEVACGSLVSRLAIFQNVGIWPVGESF